MGIFQRISKVLESNMNAMIERAEDPAKMLDQAIEDLKKGREEARAAIVEAKTELRLAEKRRDKAAAEAADLEAKAMLALKVGDEGLARKLVEAKLASEERAKAEGSYIGEHERQIADLEAAEKELGRRVQEMPAKRAALMARQAAAEARGARVGAAHKTQDRVANALDAIERMENKITHAEVEAEVRSEMEGRTPALDLRALEDHKAEQELQALKARMAAQLPAGASQKPSEPKESPAPQSQVDDSLAALKAKLQGGG